MLFGIAGDRSRPLSTGALIGVNVVALLACALGVWKILDFGLKMDEVSGNAGGLGRAIIGTASVGIGLHLVVGASVGVIVTSFIGPGAIKPDPAKGLA